MVRSNNYFGTEANKQAYLNTPVYSSDDISVLNNIYDDMSDNPNIGSIN